MYSSEIKKIMLDEMLPSFGGNKKQSKILFCFFSSIHATLSFSLTNTLFNFNNGEKSRKQQQKKILSFLFQTNFEMFS